MKSLPRAKRVLIFSHGSLGDTIVALPCFYLIARAFPDAERRLLTAGPAHTSAVSPAAVLENTGLIHDYFIYDSKAADATQFFRIRHTIYQWRPEVLIYLAEPRGVTGTWRDALFFKLCGIAQLLGLPHSKFLRENQWLPENGCFEHEAARLARCIQILGDARLDEHTSWDLKLTGREEETAAAHLNEWMGEGRFLVTTVAAKVKAKDWGEENWSRLLSHLSHAYPQLGLVVVGAEAEAEYSQKVTESWQGPLLNLCGRLTLRETAAVMKQALFYLGHDSGPMHLAAAMGVPCIALFIAPTRPGVWFPYGKGHRVIDHESNGKAGLPITSDEVFEAARHLLKEKTHFHD